MLLDKGNGVTELQHSVTVSDGQWHNLHVLFNADILELTVDGAKQTKAPMRGAQKHIDLTDRWRQY